MTKRCEAIKQIHNLFLDGKGRPYDRFMKKKFENGNKQRICAVLGEGFWEDMEFVHKVYNYSCTKKKQLKKDERNQIDPTIAATRKEWLKFLQFWLQESTLFHKDYPRSQNTSYYELRVEKLAIEIFKYLHEKCMYHQILQDDNQRESPKTWMKGHWFPSLRCCDPAHFSENDEQDDDEYFEDYIFPLEGKINFSLSPIYIKIISLLISYSR